MITILPFAKSHLDWLEPQPGQRVELLARGYCPMRGGWSFTAIDEECRVLMCAGAMPCEDGHWWAWALLSVHARRRMLALSRAVLGIMPHTPAEKIKTTVRWGFKEGHKWAVMLGFRPLRELYRIEGVWCAIYERSVRHGS